MSDAVSFVAFLAELGAAELVLRRTDGTLDAAAVALPDGRRLLAVERTYRDGIRVIFDPTPEELQIAEGGDLWDLWNSERSRLLGSIA